jgi:CHAT domain-containing protein/tetratricopeptide (TPR) repeat protein
VTRLLAALILLATATPSGAATEPELADQLAVARRLVAARDFPAAESAARALLAEAEVSSGPEALITGQVIDLLVDARLAQRKSDPECLAFAERAVRIKDKLKGPEEPETAESLRRLALVLQAQQQFAQARSPMEKALAIMEAHFGKASPQASGVLAQLAYLYRDLNIADDAVRLLQAALAAHEAAGGPDSPSIAPLLYNLAVLEHDLGDFGAAERHYMRLLPMTGEGAQERSVALNGLARVYVEQARYAEAQERFGEAIEAARSAGAHPSLIAYYLHNLGFLLTEIGAYEDAVPILEEVLRLRRDLLGNEHLDTAATLSNLADAHLRLGDCETACRLHHEALSIRQRVLRQDHQVATSLRALGSAYLEAGRAADALPLFERGLRIQIEHSGPDHHDTGEMTASLARALTALGRHEEAAIHFERALEVLEQALGHDDPEWSRARLDLARVHARLGKTDSAWRGALEAEERLRAHARLTASALSERQAVRYASITKEALDLLLDLLPHARDSSAVATSLDRVVRSRALALDIVTARHAAFAGDESPMVTKLTRAYAESSRRLASLLVQGAGGPAGEERVKLLREAREARDRLERELARSSSTFSKSLASQEVGLADVVASLPPGAGVLSYVRVPRALPDGRPDDPVYVAFAARADKQPELIPLGSAGHIDALVREWRLRVNVADPASSRALTAYRAAAVELRKAVWDPVRVAIAGLDIVFLVPDGELHRVAFYSLPDSSGSYLAESGPILHWLSAERDLRVAPHAAAGSGVLAVGDVDFGAASPRARDDRLASVTFRPLPGTGEEARAIVDLWNRTAIAARLGRATVLLGGDATETAVKEALPGRRIVHLATHGFFLDGAPARVPHGTRAIAGISAQRRQPPPGEIALSGLALAGANRPTQAETTDDGILTAEEIAALDLSAADWVVLAACDTGLGEVAKGEGVLGLRRAFEVAGARSLIMSLWEVDDAASIRWMNSLYRARLERNASTAEALRDATRETLWWCRERGSDHPFYWSAFVAAGDWR